MLRRSSRTLGAFLNTLDRRTFGTYQPCDDLTSPAALDQWLSSLGLVADGTKSTPAECALALRLRTALRNAAQAHRDSAQDEAPTADLTRKLPLYADIQPDGLINLVPAAIAGTVRHALAALLATATMATVDGTWRRVKMCAAPDCHTVFYDNSKPHNGRWCGTAIAKGCGNRTTPARYRHR
uniref:CGNR zinc finger domain-containing protein n=1 Tax=Fodinicola feengrottensis TaxID=435914 RepID=UPI0013D3F818